jgi:hypothetical protein
VNISSEVISRLAEYLTDRVTVLEVYVNSIPETDPEANTKKLLAAAGVTELVGVMNNIKDSIAVAKVKGF